MDIFNSTTMIILEFADGNRTISEIINELHNKFNDVLKTLSSFT